MTTRTIDLIKAADTHANRPAATVVPAGALYACTTHSLIYRSDGSTWSTWATVGGATGAVLLSTVTAAGDLIVASGSGAVTNLAKGSALQVLRVNAAGTALEYATPSGGSSPASPDDVPGSPDAWDYEFGATTTSLPSGFAWVNQSTSTYNEAYGRGVLTAPASSTNIRIIEKDVPAGATWTVVGKFSVHTGTGAQWWAGLSLRDSTTGKIQVTALDGRGFWIGRYSNVTTYNSLATFYSAYAAQTFYLKIKKNSSSSYDFGYSLDGFTWEERFLANDVNAFVGTLNKIGLAAGAENSDIMNLSCHWLRKTA